MWRRSGRGWSKKAFGTSALNYWYLDRNYYLVVKIGDSSGGGCFDVRDGVASTQSRRTVLGTHSLTHYVARFVYNNDRRIHTCAFEIGQFGRGV